MTSIQSKILLFLTVLLGVLATSLVSAGNVRRGDVTKSSSPEETKIETGRRRLDDEESEEDIDPDFEDGNDFEVTEIAGIAVIIPNDEEIDFDGILERQVCEPDPQRAIDFVTVMGQQNQDDASQECFEDPVNGCDGGCCRLGVYFICDTDNFAPHLPCVCNSLTGPPPTQPPAPAVVDNTLPDIVQTAIATGSFNTLVDLVATAGLVSTLSSPGPFTVFAPADSAFPTGAALEQFKNATSIEDLTRILTFHVVPGIIMSTDLEEGAMVTTVEGNNLTVSLTSGPMVNNATIVQADIETSNGVIHVIDSVLMPPPKVPDLVETAIAAGNFTTLVDLVVAAGLVETLQSPGPFTVFAPTDQAFPTGQALVEFKNNTDMATLTSILTYHVVPGKIMSTDLVDGAMIETVQGSNVEISLSATGAMVNDANVVAADIETSNGVIHIIDAVLMPTFDDATTIARTP